MNYKFNEFKHLSELTQTDWQAYETAAKTLTSSDSHPANFVILVKFNQGNYYRISIFKHATITISSKYGRDCPAWYFECRHCAAVKPMRNKRDYYLSPAEAYQAAYDFYHSLSLSKATVDGELF